MSASKDFKELSDKFGIPNRPDPSVISRRCWGCGGPLVTRDINQRYCTKQCRESHKNRHTPPQSKPKINYEAYIQSADWKEKADAAKKRAGYRCQICNRGTSQVLQIEAHHRTYERLGEELPSDITVVCNECHDLYTRHKKFGER